MKKIIVKFHNKQVKDYPIFIGNNLMKKIGSIFNLSSFSKVFVVTDQSINKLFLKKVLSKLPVNSEYIVLPSGEKEKNIESIETIWKVMLSSGCDRKSLVINLGGGVISDLGGFAATTFMRGVPFLNIPTTLLSQVDASVGGKNGINFSSVKNLIGTFNQPIGIICDTVFLKSLPNREFISGFGEIVKHGLIYDKSHFEFVTSKQPLEFNENELSEIIQKSIKIKVAIVSQDEKESAARRLVNFGHTIGHGVESLSLESKKSLLHGEAISIGMVIESQISQKLGLISQKNVELIKNSLKKIGLPVTILEFKPTAIIQKIKKDKKSERGKINWTLLKNIGQGICDQAVDEKLVREVLYESNQN